jgi:TonB family protein
VEPAPEAPPPQFGLQEEQLSETGDLAVATGNTLMTEADSVVKAPVQALPALPQLVDQAPRILKGRPPEYPMRALERGLEATVVVLITIDTLGRVSRVDVERSGGRDFDPEVLRAVKALVFQPPVRNGKRTAARFRQPYEFKLQ